MDPLPSCSPYLPSYLPPPCLKLLSFHSPTISYLYTLTADVLYPKVLQLYSYPALPPTLPFRFLRSFMVTPLLPEPSPTITHSFTLFIRAFYPLPDPSHPPAPACPPPLPSFSLFWLIYGYFCIYFLSYPIYTCTYMIHSIEYQTFDRFLGVLSAARVGECISIWCGNLAPKKHANIQACPLIHALWTPHSRYTVGSPYGSLQQPPIGSREDALPPGTDQAQIRHRGSQIPDLEAIDEPCTWSQGSMTGL